MNETAMIMVLVLFGIMLMGTSYMLFGEYFIKLFNKDID